MRQMNLMKLKATAFASNSEQLKHLYSISLYTVQGYQIEIVDYWFGNQSKPH